MTMTLQITDPNKPGVIIAERELGVGYAFVEVITEITEPRPDFRMTNIAVGVVSILSFEHGGRTYTLTADAESRNHFCFCVVAPACEWMELDPERHGEDTMEVVRFLKPLAVGLSGLHFVADERQSA